MISWGAPPTSSLPHTKWCQLFYKLLSIGDWQQIIRRIKDSECHTNHFWATNWRLSVLNNCAAAATENVNMYQSHATGIMNELLSSVTNSFWWRTNLNHFVIFPVTLSNFPSYRSQHVLLHYWTGHYLQRFTSEPFKHIILSRWHVRAHHCEIKRQIRRCRNYWISIFEFRIKHSKPVLSPWGKCTRE